MANYRRLSDSAHDFEAEQPQSWSAADAPRQHGPAYESNARHVTNADVNGRQRPIPLSRDHYLSPDQAGYNHYMNSGYDPGHEYNFDDSVSYTIRLSESTAYDADPRYLPTKQTDYSSRVPESTFIPDYKHDDSEEDPLKQKRSSSPSEQHLPFWQAVNKWPKLVLYCLGLASIIMLHGYDGSLVSNVAGMPEFKKVYGAVANGQEIIPAKGIALWNVGSNLGSMIGALIGGWLGDRIGRRCMLLGSSVCVACSVTLFLVSDLPSTNEARCGLFFVAKILQGTTIGALVATTQTYMSEVTPSALKGPVLATFPVFILLGQILGAVVLQPQYSVEGRKGYRIGLASQYAFSIPPLIMSILLPESPTWLLHKHRDSQARAAFDKLLKGKSSPSTQLSFTELQEAIALERGRSKSEHISYVQCFQGIDLRRTLIVIFAACAPEFFGLNLVGNAILFLETVDIEGSTANLTFIIGATVCLISMVISFWTLTIFRRRQLFVSTLAIVTGIWLFIGITGVVSNRNFTKWAVVVCFVLLTMTAGLGVWPTSFVVSGETSSLRLRSRSQGVAWTVSGGLSCIISIVMPYVYNPDAGNMGAKTGFVYVGLGAIATAISYFYLPEMKDRNPAELDEMFAIGLPARRFKSWTEDG